jgi:hypothetical protein
VSPAPADPANATTTPTPATPDAAPAAPAKPDPAPAPVEVKLPDGSLLNADHAKAIADFATKNAIKPEVAQQILQQQSDAVAAHDAALRQQHLDQVKTWDKALADDKEIGGEAIKANLDMGRRALERYGSPELVEALRSSGYNSFPPLVKLLVNIGKAMGEDRLATGNGTGGKSDADILAERYPKMFAKT